MFENTFADSGIINKVKHIVGRNRKQQHASLKRDYFVRRVFQQTLTLTLYNDHKFVPLLSGDGS